MNMFLAIFGSILNSTPAVLGTAQQTGVISSQKAQKATAFVALGALVAGSIVTGIQQAKAAKQS